eukprot:CAMPEP_0175106450 /NCGR_PEP_ID=MMETSP0086_2-20121207/11206_1 /TAXON_ID=136419 /ORGANISM="Unknown Unknown, Strain D1" /LENGTH=280 /DNA_ID=CAMNT_0016382787 /DNA_START=18 /DNA_END=860 /DNA_ORIENTATION=-
MSLITVENVTVLDNPSKFSNPFQFEITFSCSPPGIPGELEWKLTYVGSADDEKYDQELDSVLVGPIAVGRNKFVFQAPSPDSSKIPEKDLLEVTVILLTCSYLDQEFIRVGYYVNNDYGPNLELMSEYTRLKEAGEQPRVALDQLHRHILSDKPRVTRFQIHWSQEELNASRNPAPIPGLQDNPEYQGNEEEEEDMDDDDNMEDDEDDENSEDELDDEDIDLEDDDKENLPDSCYPQEVAAAGKPVAQFQNHPAGEVQVGMHADTSSSSSSMMMGQNFMS